MKKLAYIFFGQVKNYGDLHFDSFTQHVAPTISDYEVDYFLITSKNDCYDSPRNRKHEGRYVSIDYRTILKYFNFKKVYFDGLEKQESEIVSEITETAKKIVKEFGCPHTWSRHGYCVETTANSFKQLYSLKYFYDQFTKDGFLEYDHYVLSRGDILHQHPLNSIAFGGSSTEVYVPDFGWWEGGCNDRFAVLNDKTALQVYCSRYPSVSQIQKEYHAENYLYRTLLDKKLNVKPIPNFDFRLVRANGELEVRGRNQGRPK
jgi:hypothetical protein